MKTLGGGQEGEGEKVRDALLTEAGRIFEAEADRAGVGAGVGGTREPAFLLTPAGACILGCQERSDDKTRIGTRGRP